MGAPEVVVLDTNVLVSALGWKGPERRIYRGCREGDLQMATSHVLLIELARVLRYPKFAFSAEEVADFLADIGTHALIVRPGEVVDVVRDSADNRVLECALAAKAPWVVSGDKHLLELGHFHDVRIVSSTEFLARR